MAVEDIEKEFPLLAADGYEIRSDEDFNYNCLAFVLGDRTNWWEPPGEPGFYWPPGFSEDVSVETAVRILKFHGFTLEHDPRTEPTTEAVAIYANGSEWTHFAKFTGGQWLSKLGNDHDIAHSSLRPLEGNLYGRVAMILSRNRADR